MPRKRHVAPSHSSVKRRKLDDNISSEAQSPSRRLTENQKAELIHWLDQAEKKGQPIFTIVVPPVRKGKQKSPEVSERHLILNDKNYLDARWTIKPMDTWLQMTKYKKFTVGNQTHQCGDCVLVKPPNGSNRDWKAQVHEVRAADEHHVFLRCTWLENPEELPKEVLSTPPYHGRFELVPSNKMDVIDALTVNGPLKVVHWDEADDDAKMPESGEYFWRHTYDYDSNILTPLRLICKCKQPHNPDNLIIKCSNEACGIWLHASCLAQGATQHVKAEPEAKTKRRGQKSPKKINHAKDAADDNGACAEDEATRAEVIAPESGSPQILVTNKKTGEESKEPVHCLVCEELIQ